MQPPLDSAPPTADPKNIVFREIPNIDDPSFLEVGIGFEDMDRLAGSLVHASLRLNAPSTVTVALVMCLLNRVRESARSIFLLCSKSRVRDAAVLQVNLIELRLDLQFIGLGAQHESTWLKHQNTKRKPWKVKEQFEAVFTSTAEREAELDRYEKVSMIKHGNPAGNEYSFSIWRDGENIVLSGEGLLRLAPEFLCAACFDLANACRASIKILRRHGTDLSEFKKAIDDAVAELSKGLELRVHRNMLGWVRQNVPGFVALEAKKKRLQEDLERTQAEIRRLEPDGVTK